MCTFLFVATFSKKHAKSVVSIGTYCEIPTKSVNQLSGAAAWRQEGGTTSNEESFHAVLSSFKILHFDSYYVFNWFC